MAENIDFALLELLNGSGSSFLDGMMLVLTSGITWIPLYVALLYLVINNSETMAQIMLCAGAALLCVVLAGGVCDYIVKPLVGRLRPINDPMIRDVVWSVSALSTKSFSFFSSHAANTMSLTVFFSLLVRNSRLTAAMLLWTLTNCYSRIYLGMHFPSDVLAGMVWGAAVGTLVYSLHSRLLSHLSEGGEYISTQYTSKGYTIATVDIVVLTLVSMYIIAALVALIIQ